MEGTATTPISHDKPDGDITLVASSGESDGGSEYIEPSENSPTRSANNPELKGYIQELEFMHKVSEEDIDAIA